MATHSIEPTRENVHGKFSREREPILRIESGDTVVFRTLDAGWNVGERTSANPEDRPAKLHPIDPDKDAGHCLCGPIWIDGAERGMTLEIRIEDVQVGSWGWTSCAGWAHAVHKRLRTDDPPEIFYLWKLDREGGIARNQHGHEVNLRPFMGVMGMPPDEPGFHSTAPPRFCGGNLDCKELSAGTSLFLPISVPGALFSVGDGHATQGDGEACVTAIECPMSRVQLTFVLHRDMKISTPRARIDGGWITLGVHEDLDEACFRALEAMTDLMGELHGLDRRNALALASLAVDLRVTQIVNGVQGVHAVLRDDAVRFPRV